MHGDLPTADGRPPLLTILPDADRAVAAARGFEAAYQERGFGAGLAAFLAFASWLGEYPEDYAARPTSDLMTTCP